MQESFQAVRLGFYNSPGGEVLGSAGWCTLSFSSCAISASGCYVPGLPHRQSTDPPEGAGSRTNSSGYLHGVPWALACFPSPQERCTWRRSCLPLLRPLITGNSRAWEGEMYGFVSFRTQEGVADSLSRQGNNTWAGEVGCNPGIGEDRH